MSFSSPVSFSSHTRRGNALAVSMGLVVIAAAAVTMSTERVADRVELTRTMDYEQRAVTALQAVLTRQEERLQRLIADGNTDNIANFDYYNNDDLPSNALTSKHEKFYGETDFGQCRVRWKIEPCVMDIPLSVSLPNIDTSDDVQAFVTNPAPNPYEQSNHTDKHLTNDFTYVYRISGESRYLADEDLDSDGDLWNETEHRARVQGARYMAFERTPVFRFVIFYTQIGPKGDLEFSHFGEVNVDGDVQSNGAIYLGSGTAVNNWMARIRSNHSASKFGDSKAMRMTGVDGIFRMSKPLNYALFTDWFHPTRMDLYPGNVDTTYFTNGSFPMDGRHNEIFGASLAEATNNFKFFNPYRFSGEDIATQGSDIVRINGNILTKDNDSRDRNGRSYIWNPTSLTNFNSTVRSSLTAGRIFPVTEDLANRSMEAQALQYQDEDGEIHIYAMPLFHRVDRVATNDQGQVTNIPPDPNDGTATPTRLAGETGGQIEVPGYFVRRGISMKNDYFMQRVYTYNHIGRSTNHDAATASARRPQPTSWRVVDSKGQPVTRFNPEMAGDKVGLIIRERLVPYWGEDAAGTTPPQWGSAPKALAVGAAGATPYAYGKHTKPTLWPFAAMWVTDRGRRDNNGHSDERIASSLVRTQGSGVAEHSGRSWQTYEWGGTLTFSAAANTGGQGGHQSLTDTNGWYRSNWRMVNLKRHNSPVGANNDKTNLSPASPNNVYFEGNRFKSFTARLADIEGGRQLAGTTIDIGAMTLLRKAGLMIRPMRTGSLSYSDLTSVTINHGDQSSARGLNGRHPYGAMLFSPERGFFNERRLAPSTSQTVGALYTATWDSLPAQAGDRGNGQPGTRHVVNVPNSYTQINRVDNQSHRTHLSVHANSVHLKIYRELGNEGSARTFRFHRGPFRYRNDRWYKRWTDAIFNVQIFENTFADQFRTPDAQRRIRMYNPQGLPTRQNWRSSQFGPDNGYDISRVLDARTLELFMPGNNVVENRNHIYSDPAGTVNDIIAWSDGYSAARAWVGNDTNFLHQQLAIHQYGVVNKPTPKYAAIPDSPAQPPAPPLPNLGSGKHFSIDRQSRMETNAFVGTRGTIFTPPVREWLPRANTTIVNALPLTTSFQLDQWSGTRAPGQPDNWRTAGLGRLNPHTWNPNRSYWEGEIIRRNNGQQLYYRALGNLPVGTPPPPDGEFSNLNWQYHDAFSWQDRQHRAWTPNTAYALWDVVQRGNAFFQVIRGHTSDSTNKPGLNGGADSGIYWAECDQVWLRIRQEAGSGNDRFLIFEYAIFSSALESIDGAPDLWVDPEDKVRLEPHANWWNELLPGPPDDPNAPWPADANQRTRLQVAGDTLAADRLAWGNYWLIGCANQSGSENTSMRTVFTDMEIVLAPPANGTEDEVINRTVWEGGDPANSRIPNAMTKYLASQYQVFWGPTDITEDFFLYNQNNGTTRLAREEWFVNPREFWSQSRWWNEESRAGADNTRTSVPPARNTWINKEARASYTDPYNGNQIGGNRANVSDNDNMTKTIQRRRWARTTYLEVNLEELHEYMKDRTIDVASRTRFWGPDIVLDPADTKMKDEFNGMLYAARTNRYPWNPSPGEFDLDGDNVADETVTRNPYNWYLPNLNQRSSLADPLTADRLIGNYRRQNDLSDRWGNQTAPAARALAVGSDALHPYRPADVPYAPPIRPEDFHHGVMWSNGQNINWGIDAGSEFGDGGTLFVSPNATYIRGNFNSLSNPVFDRNTNTVTDKITPVGVVADSITLLSNDWNPLLYRLDRLTTDQYGNLTGDILANIHGPPVRQSATYRFAVITHNQPTSAERVYQGQGAAFIDTFMFLEDWASTGTPVEMNFVGSLVVTNSRRYTRSYLLDGYKKNGRGPFGIMGWHSQEPYSGLNNVPDWPRNRRNLGSPPIYNPPVRNYSFNRDLLRREGTPPFTPVGVTATGTASWVRILRN